MEQERLNILKEVLSIPSTSGEEDFVIEYLINFAEEKGYDCEVDNFGNVYVTKGNAETYPCVCSHMDTVHNRQPKHIEENNGNLRAYLKGPYTAKSIKKQIGIGGDDLCGVFLCMEMLQEFDNMKAAFFVKEEIGCIGSRNADPTFFENVGYIIEFDSPGNDTVSWYCSGVRLFSEGFANKTEEGLVEGKIGDLLMEHGHYNFAIHPFTDVSYLKRSFDVECINLSVGYYNMHTSYEYVSIKDVENARQLGSKIINRLGEEKQSYAYDPKDQYVYDHKKTLKEMRNKYNIDLTDEEWESIY